MTIVTLEKEKLSKTNFLDLKDLFDYAIDNQIISELGIIDKKNLSHENQISFDKLNDTSDLINI